MNYYEKKIKHHKELLEKAKLAGNDREIKIQEADIAAYEYLENL